MRSIENDGSILYRIQERQFREMSQLRRRIFSILPIRNSKRIIEPGCGTGLLLRELFYMTDARITGFDRDKNALEKAEKLFRQDSYDRNPLLLHRDAENRPLFTADIYISSFFLYQLKDPLVFLKRVRTHLTESGVYAVAGEYDYMGIGESPDLGMKNLILDSLKMEGFHTEFGASLDDIFSEAGFVKRNSGRICGRLQIPDWEFLEFQLSRLFDGNYTQTIINRAKSRNLRMSFIVVWGIFSAA